VAALELETQKMKSLLPVFVVCIFGCVGAMGQVAMSGANGQPQMLVLPDYAQHASQTGMAQSHDLMERSGTTSAHGDRPLWEFMPEPQVTPLGDSARDIRKDHAKAKKAVIVWKN
jgi:hypothetical protein